MLTENVNVSVCRIEDHIVAASRAWSADRGRVFADQRPLVIRDGVRPKISEVFLAYHYRFVRINPAQDRLDIPSHPPNR